MEEKLAKREFLVCIDSDGSAMNTMEPKHRLCFAPLFAQEFSLNKNYDEIVEYWLWYNLYSETRGVNRFKACAHLLKKFSPALYGVEEYLDFVENSDELSNRALEKAIENAENPTVMKKVLSWSLNVNNAINKLTDLEPFDGVKDAFIEMYEYCDIAAVSSANKKALSCEWHKYSLSYYCCTLMSQEEGTKAQCIKKLLDLGYDKSKVIMVGDALGDYEAAKENGVYFYPIIMKKEAQSWAEIMDEAIIPLVKGTLNEAKQKKWINEFEKALGGKE